MFGKKNGTDSYARMQAFEEGVLIDFTTMAADAAFNDPVAFTSGAFEKYVRDPRDPDWEKCDGRAWEVLKMLRHAVEHLGVKWPEIRFVVLIDNGDGPKPVTLKAVRRASDAGFPWVIIMLPEED